MDKDKPRELSDIILRAPNMRPRVRKADFNIFLNVISYVDGSMVVFSCRNQIRSWPLSLRSVFRLGLRLNDYM